MAAKVSKAKQGGVKMPSLKAGSRLFSTRKGHAPLQRLNVDVLADGLSDATRVFVASAYYDPAFCKAMLSKVPRDAKSVQLVFNGLGGTRLLRQRDELVDLQKELKKRVKATEIRLAFESGIFHTKLIIAYAPRSTVAYIGSANATMAAMTVNEEILLRISGDDELTVYAERIWKSALPLEELENQAKARGLVAFFRTGALYFKPSSSLQTTLNPLHVVAQRATRRGEAKLGTATLPFADQETGIGPFSLRKALGLADDPVAEDEDDGRGNIGVKPYSIETSLGYWVPDAMEAPWQERLRKAGNVKRKRWMPWKVALDGAAGMGIGTKYAAYLEAVRTLLIGSGVAFSAHIARRARDPFDVGTVTGFVERIRARLASSDYLDRLCSPFVRGAMPEIWDDPVAHAEFETSFFDYLEFIANGPGNWPKVPGLILRKLDVEKGAARDAKSIKAALKAHLARDGWGAGDW